MSGGKGGSKTTEVVVPDYVDAAARANLNRATDVGNVGNVVYRGPDVAAFSPMQQSAFQNTANMANAFGMAAPTDQAAIMGGMGEPTQYADGVSGYSSAGIYDDALEALKASSPGQYDYINSLFVDQQTGDAGSRAGVDLPPPPVAAPAAYSYSPVIGGGHISGVGGGTGDDFKPGHHVPNSSLEPFGGAGPNVGGGTNVLSNILKDARDGGGMGGEGGKHKGLGLASVVANVLGGNYN
tara:strand:+ start:2342 stop:3058 length:717 start_codon:yes stop_codon:yes gene_type:complete